MGEGKVFSQHELCIYLGGRDPRFLLSKPRFHQKPRKQKIRGCSKNSFCLSLVRVTVSSVSVDTRIAKKNKLQGVFLNRSFLSSAESGAAHM
ncbi:hypothetical protein TNCT_633501 [Trichonephila clavata]|uniref:Uncharacterized protein n=1 Tax=Trichonephila clavata TaxID=2740835 RepID=A0A8X6HRX0_TRICU|nr:hypothetical protein TNCT_633501 [Trichonephila clavata]